VLGIGADDIFVFVDAWNQSAYIDNKIIDSNEKRMAYTFRRASRAMAVTSSTTAVAFFANFFSPIMPVKSFGITSALIIPLNYFLVIMFFPSAVILYDDRVKPYVRCWPDKLIIYNGQLSRVEKFFDNHVNRLVAKGKWVIIGISVIWLGITIW